MRRIGLTGGMGMGKSAAAGFMARRGLPVVDTDQLAREVAAPGSGAVEEIARLLGPEVLRPDGALNRERVAQRVFANESLRKGLEAILHPRIRAAWHSWLEARTREGQERAVVVVPLLYEVNLAADFDCVICVACTAATQAARLAQREWSPEQIRLRNAAQWPVEKKMALADFVLWSEGTLEALDDQIERVLRRV